MRRRIFTLVSAFSVLMFAGTAGLLTMSWRQAWVMRYGGGGTRVDVVVGRRVLLVDTYLQPVLVLAKRGRLSMRFERRDGFGNEGCHWEFNRYSEDEIWDPATRLPTGDHLVSHPNKSGRDAGAVELSIPMWLLLSSAAVLPIVALPSRRPRIRRRISRCPICGYDLRATPERCPECGMVSAAEKVKA
jgi:hypothetical protein